MAVLLVLLHCSALVILWADPVPEASTRVRSGEGNNRSKVLPPQKFCRETASNYPMMFFIMHKVHKRKRKGMVEFFLCNFAKPQQSVHFWNGASWCIYVLTVTVCRPPAKRIAQAKLSVVCKHLATIISTAWSKYNIKKCLLLKSSRRQGPQKFL
jgi:hypothetical protein